MNAQLDTNRETSQTNGPFIYNIGPGAAAFTTEITFTSLIDAGWVEMDSFIAAGGHFTKFQLNLSAEVCYF